MIVINDGDDLKVYDYDCHGVEYNHNDDADHVADDVADDVDEDDLALPLDK